MNTFTKIQIEFGEPATPQQIPVRHVTATASRLPGVAWVESNFKYDNVNPYAGSDSWSVETKQFIARIREVMQKRGLR